MDEGMNAYNSANGEDYYKNYDLIFRNARTKRGAKRRVERNASRGTEADFGGDGEERPVVFRERDTGVQTDKPHPAQRKHGFDRRTGERVQKLTLASAERAFENDDWDSWL